MITRVFSDENIIYSSDDLGAWLSLYITVFLDMRKGFMQIGWILYGTYLEWVIGIFVYSLIRLFWINAENYYEIWASCILPMALTLVLTNDKWMNSNENLYLNNICRAFTANN